MSKLSYVYEVDEAVTELASLAGLDCSSVVIKIDGSRGRGFRITKTEYFVDISGLPALGGPILYGLAVGLSSAEIEEAIEADPQDPNGVPEHEQVKRPVFPLGVFRRAQNTSESSVDNPIDMPLRTVNLNWSIPEGVGLQWWFYNLGGATDAGTNGTIFAKHTGVWLND